MRSCLIPLALLALLAGIPASASAQWSDDFDTYANGSGIIGQGGWEGWDGSAADAVVTDVASHSAPHSLEVGPNTDVVQQFSGVNGDTWIMSAWQYIPGNATGDTYFILLNAYSPDGTANENWSTQVRFGGGVVESEFDGATLPLMLDKWVEIRVVVDFMTDTQTISYGGNVLTSKSWADGVTGGGVPNLAALDLFGNSSSPVYYDDFDLSREGSTPTETASWGDIKGRFRQ